MCDLSSLSERKEQRQAFDSLVKMLQESLLLTAKVISQGKASSRAFKATLERYAGLYGRSGYQSMPLAHLFESAINWEAMLNYEYQQAANRLSEENALRNNYITNAAVHKNRMDEFFNAVRRAHNLNVSTNYPYVMPYRVFFIFPYSLEIEKLLRQSEEHFVRWNGGVVTILPEDVLHLFKKLAEEIVLLSYDADELLNQSLNSTQPELEEIWASQLKTAHQSPSHTGESFSHHINRCLLKQNTILLNLLPRLSNEHSTAKFYLEPFVNASVAEFQKHLSDYPSWIPEGFSDSMDSKNMLASLEKKINAVAQQYVKAGKEKDAAGLFYQFKAISEAGSPLEG
jgi:hypothetical protein